MEKNCIESVPDKVVGLTHYPDKAWFAYFRVYCPTGPCFKRVHALPDRPTESIN